MAGIVAAMLFSLNQVMTFHRFQFRTMFLLTSWRSLFNSIAENGGKCSAESTLISIFYRNTVTLQVVISGLLFLTFAVSNQITTKISASRFGKTKLRIIAGVVRVSKQHFKDSWKKQGWVDTRLEKWKERQKLTKQDRRTKKRRSILVQSGNLRRGFKVTSRSFDKITIINELPYAETHNSGDPKRNIPQRQFMGESKALDRKVRREILKHLNDLFK